MQTAFFVSDLHGFVARLDALFAAIAAEHPSAVFIGGDMLPRRVTIGEADGIDFLTQLAQRLEALRASLHSAYPPIFVIPGNDDPRAVEAAMVDIDTRGLWHYVQGRKIEWRELVVYGYGCVPPTPFRLKDWERYDVSRYVDPGCCGPEEGYHSVPFDEHELRRSTIASDLDALAGNDPLDRAICLFHAPPYNTALDRAALDGRMVEHVPLDVHVGSIAVRRFIEARQPLATLHGHVHESASLTGCWQERLGRTVCLSAAHDGPELALVRFDPEDPAAATRELVGR